MTILDWLYSVLIGVGLFVDHIVFNRMFAKRAADDRGNAFRWLWCRFLVYMWGYFTLGVLLWGREGRTWSAIGIVLPGEPKARIGWILFVFLALVYVAAASRLRGNTHRLTELAKRLERSGVVAAMTSRTRDEFRLWVVVSLTAGITEEFICRGYLIWVFCHWMTWWPAAAAALTVFALGHSYQGVRGILESAVVGALLTATVAMCHSLLPAMALHALVDICNGYAAWLANQMGSSPDKRSIPVHA